MPISFSRPIRGWLRTTPLLSGFLALTAVHSQTISFAYDPAYLICAEFLLDEFPGPAGAAGGVQTAFPNGLPAVNANPAHAGLIDSFEFSAAGQTITRPENRFCLQAGWKVPGFGVLSASVTALLKEPGYGDRRNLAWSLTYGRRAPSWLAWGITIRRIDTEYGTVPLKCVSWDAGFLLLTGKLSQTGERDDGFKFGASLSNNEIIPVREASDRFFGYPDRTQFHLPRLCRIGFSFVPIVSEATRFTFGSDLLVPFSITREESDMWFDTDFGGDIRWNLGCEERIQVAGGTQVMIRLGIQSLNYGPYSEEEKEPTAGLGISGPLTGNVIFESGLSWMRVKRKTDRCDFYCRIHL